MEYPARLVTTVALPLGPCRERDVWTQPGPGGPLLVQRGDEELVAARLDGSGATVRFPAPWPRDFGGAAVSPDGSLALFAGVHALRAVEPDGTTRWEAGYDCWADVVCTVRHSSFAEYAGDRGHRGADGGSAAFSADGKLVWAHVRVHAGSRAPETAGGQDAADGETRERWAVLDAADGTVLGSVDTGTFGAGHHCRHPDPARMGLSVGQGDEDSPALWGRWDGRALTVDRFDEEVLLASSPSGRRLLTVDTLQAVLCLRDAAGGAEPVWSPVDPWVTAEERILWALEAAFPAEDAVVAATETAGEPRHWLVDGRTLAVRGPIGYPVRVSGCPRPAAPGTWATGSADLSAVHLWALGS
ncbi:hypothetical protein [Streptomyces abyssomicinicus]|uniref:hypothetical protein n=1 Tax=Streptomyces abyssomicinicus TaxID=574929 RepID=UPI001FE6E475|nr:hypothetical protein [Streptomyces abyssomicinicus]